jgi:uncharacterized protein with HEPN domain
MEQRYEDIILELTVIGECLKKQSESTRSIYEVLKLLIEREDIKPHTPFNKGERL